MAKRFSPICFKSYKTDTKIEVIDSLGFGDLPLELGSHTSFTVYLDLHYVELETLQDTVPSDRVKEKLKRVFYGCFGSFACKRGVSGIVASELGYPKAHDDSNNPVLTSSRKNASNAVNTSLVPETNPGDSTGTVLWISFGYSLDYVCLAGFFSFLGFFSWLGFFADLALVWLAAITSIAVWRISVESGS
ncbi:hypothetical protein HPP92_002199 [Vanilla planifolia]|uniref:Uncharacterized protein n=1 Tax=Vanilla planifolia TaxID=51239 RepID=A0A835SE96_VANPL|nr:hypothetical protein HPP92_002199 [Vanilla planifolia]